MFNNLLDSVGYRKAVERDCGINVYILYMYWRQRWQFIESIEFNVDGEEKRSDLIVTHTMYRILHCMLRIVRISICAIAFIILLISNLIYFPSENHILIMQDPVNQYKLMGFPINLAHHRNVHIGNFSCALLSLYSSYSLEMTKHWDWKSNFSVTKVQTHTPADTHMMLKSYWAGNQLLRHVE